MKNTNPSDKTVPDINPTKLITILYAFLLIQSLAWWLILAGTPGNRTQQTALRRLNGVEDRGGHQPRNHPQCW